MGRKVKDILVAVVGLTPQVITETLQALRCRRNPVKIGEVWALTTSAGRERCLRDLLGDGGVFRDFCREQGIGRKSIRFDASTIVVFRDEQGALLEDIRTERDNVTVGNQICDFIRSRTEREDVRLHCSIAGGRKTMGVLLASALQLYGRESDRLYHVLVSEPYESLPEFFYRPRRKRMIRGRDGRMFDARHAVVEFAEVPYVRLRGILDGADANPQGTFEERVGHAQSVLSAMKEPEPLTVDECCGNIRIGERRVPLTARQRALYAYFIDRKARHCEKPSLKICEECSACYPTIAKDTWNAVNPSAPGDIGVLRTMISKINRVIEKVVGSRVMAGPYHIRAVGPRGAKRYGIALDRRKIAEKRNISETLR